MVAIADGQLCQQFLNDSILNSLKIKANKDQDSLLYVRTLSLLISVRKNLPKSPSFMLGKGQVTNMSLMSMTQGGPKIHSDNVNYDANEIWKDIMLNHLNIKPEM